MRWIFSMQPIKFTVTALIPCGRGSRSNQSATQFRFWTDFSQGNEVACLCVQGSVSGALSNRKHGLFHIRYFENGPLESGYRFKGLSQNMPKSPGFADRHCETLDLNALIFEFYQLCRCSYVYKYKNALYFYSYGFNIEGAGKFLCFGHNPAQCLDASKNFILCFYKNSLLSSVKAAA